MKFCSIDWLVTHAPFLVVTRNGAEGLVTEVRNTTNDVILEIHENHEQLRVRFPKGACTPYSGEIVEIQYRNFMFPFLKPSNVVLSWSRKRSPIREVHNTIDKKGPSISIGILLH